MVQKLSTAWRALERQLSSPPLHPPESLQPHSLIASLYDLMLQDQFRFGPLETGGPAVLWLLSTLSAGIYRVCVLMYGKRPSRNKLMRWLRDTRGTANRE